MAETQFRQVNYSDVSDNLHIPVKCHFPENWELLTYFFIYIFLISSVKFDFCSVRSLLNLFFYIYCFFALPLTLAS